MPILLFCFLAFISLGLPDGILGVAWPSMRATFDLPLDAIGALLAAFVTGYVGASFANGPLLERMSVGTLLGLSCGATGFSLFGYAFAPGWWVVVGFAFLTGLGAGAIDAALNTYVALHYDARTLNLLHACYGVGAAAGPLIMTSVLATGAGWQSGYGLVAIAQIVLALLFLCSRRHWFADEHRHKRPLGSAPIMSTLRLPAAWLGMLSFFLYTGLEASAGAWAYTLLTESRGVVISVAGLGVSSFWGGLMLGRVIAGLALAGWAVERLLWTALVLVGAAVGALFVSTSAAVSLTALAVLGTACGPIFPSLIAMTEKRVGAEHTGNTVGFQIAGAALGQTAMPTVAGAVAAELGLEAITWVLLILAIALIGTRALVVHPKASP